jgi:hypothetical protein
MSPALGALPPAPRGFQGMTPAPDGVIEKGPGQR